MHPRMRRRPVGYLYGERTVQDVSPSLHPFFSHAVSETSVECSRARRGEEGGKVPFGKTGELGRSTFGGNHRPAGPMSRCMYSSSQATYEVIGERRGKLSSPRLGMGSFSEGWPSSRRGSLRLSARWGSPVLSVDKVVSSGRSTRTRPWASASCRNVAAVRDLDKNCELRSMVIHPPMTPGKEVRVRIKVLGAAARGPGKLPAFR